MCKVVCALFIIPLTCGICLAKYSGGKGEPNDPYLIATPNDLNSIGLDSNDWDKHFKMVADINMAGFTGTQFNIIGDYPSNPFSGIFDGNGHKVMNFTYEGSSLNFVGLFSFVGNNCQIKDISLIDPNIVVLDGRYVAALVGLMDGGHIIDCSVINGHVDAFEPLGGLVSQTRGSSMISYCSAEAKIIGNNLSDQIGILVGWHDDGVILSCHSAGYIQGRISVGGLVGNMDSGSMYDCYSTADCSGEQEVGGLIGAHSDSAIVNCYATGAILGQFYIGEIVGKSWSGSFDSCFWNSQIDPNISGIGNKSDPNVIGLMTAEMQRRSTFVDAGWDMVNVWDIGENQTYPFLRKHLPSDINKDDQTNFLDLVILAGNWLKEE